MLAVLERPEATANKYLAVSELKTTQNEVLAAAERIQGVKYQVSHISSEELLRSGDERFAKGDHMGFVDFLEAHLYGDGAGHAVVTDSDNAILALERSNLDDVLKSILL